MIRGIPRGEQLLEEWCLENFPSEDSFHERLPTGVVLPTESNLLLEISPPGEALPMLKINYLFINIHGEFKDSVWLLRLLLA